MYLIKYLKIQRDNLSNELKLKKMGFYMIKINLIIDRIINKHITKYMLNIEKELIKDKPNLKLVNEDIKKVEILIKNYNVEKLKNKLNSFKDYIKLLEVEIKK